MSTKEFKMVFVRPEYDEESFNLYQAYEKAVHEREDGEEGYEDFLCHRTLSEE